MATPLRVLIAEDSEDDAAALVHELRRGGYDPEFERVETPDGMKSALAEGHWDLVIADFSMPRFSAAAALTLLQESGLDVPFIILSGVMGEDAAVAAMKAGAHDYIFKGNMTRLVPAIQRELSEAARRAEHRVLENTAGRMERDHEERLRTEKLIAVGRLSGGVAHDLRNPLGAINNAAYTLNKWLGAEENAHSPKISDSIEVIIEQVARANAIISDLMDYSQVKGPSLVPVNMADFIDESLANLADNGRVEIEEIQIVKEYDLEMPAVLADAVQISRVFVNLAINACEAMPDGGRLTVRTSTTESHAEIEFNDTGMGIEEVNLPSLFDPLFTTKFKGTGLGLAICSEIVSRHGGNLQVASTVGVGTTFTIRLPLEGQVAYRLVLEPQTKNHVKPFKQVKGKPTNS